MPTILHVSDLHFGQPAVPEQIDAIEEQIRTGGFDVVAISGDLSQRARSGEFQRAHAFIRDAKKHSAVITVPGNHDVHWWRAPLGVRSVERITENYRKYISADLEPTVRIDGVTLVGLNTAQGVSARTLTWRMRDISIIGDLRPFQIDRARQEFEKSPQSDCRVIVMHHNPVKGELSGRHGLKHTKKILGAFAEIDVDLVLCGHDHQEAVHFVEHTRKGTVISTAGTVSNRSRGGRPSSLNVIDVSADEINVTTSIWSAEKVDFFHGPSRCFKR